MYSYDLGAVILKISEKCVRIRNHIDLVYCCPCDGLDEDHSNA